MLDNANELTAIPLLLAPLAEDKGLQGALVAIDAIATNGTVTTAIHDAGGNYRLAVKANQHTLHAKTEPALRSLSPAASKPIQTTTRATDGSSSIPISVMRGVDWRVGERRFRGELRLPDVVCIVRVNARIQHGKNLHEETRAPNLCDGR
ncbi:MAG: hypothetical protein JSS43_25640 [Proteobacteria bacterium]|nr:hypothetical protein [Pseudomonadota bacterium]